MKIELEVDFKIGDAVEFKDKRGMDSGYVTGYSVRQNGVSYAVVWSNKSESWHYNFELKSVNNGKIN